MCILDNFHEDVCIDEWCFWMFEVEDVFGKSCAVNEDGFWLEREAREERMADINVCCREAAFANTFVLASNKCALSAHCGDLFVEGEKRNFLLDAISITSCVCAHKCDMGTFGFFYCSVEGRRETIAFFVTAHDQALILFSKLP